LTARQLGIVERIRQKVGDRYLRFVLLPELAIFNATRGPCLDAAGGYEVLNLPSDGWHYTFYEPGENPYDLEETPP